MKLYQAGLRCQDVHAGLRNVDPASGTLAPLMTTRLVGMAATLASFIRGRDIVQDAQALQAVAAQQLDVDLYAFREVVDLLEQVGVVALVRRAPSGQVISFTETVPHYADLYQILGSAWAGREPAQLEQELVAVVDRLASGPVPRENISTDIGVQPADVARLLELGRESHLIKIASAPNGDILYSPFFAFENPVAMDELVAKHGSGLIAEEFEKLRGYQGLPVTPGGYPALSDAVARGLVMAPAVKLPSGTLQPFAALPYTLHYDLLTVRKPILEKALAVLACLRTGQHFGGYSSLTPAQVIVVLDKLLKKGYLNPHSSSERQYQLMHRAGLVVYDPDPKPGGRWVLPRFVDTQENREALTIARDLILHGESMQDRLGDDAVRRMWNQNGELAAPMQTVARYRAKTSIDSRTFNQLVEAAMGRKAR